MGQFATIEGLLITGMLLLILREQDVLTRFLLEVGVSKPQML